MGIFQQFPYTNFHEMNLDQLIKIMREMQDEWAETKNEWESVQDFINNYFETLDVSAEVLNALEVLASDGTLANIINPEISATVTEWLADNIGPTTPAIDASLSIYGAGADAKMTGDNFDIASKALNYGASVLHGNPRNGTISAGTIVASTNNVCWSEPLEIGRRLFIHVDDGYRAYVAFYDENHAYINWGGWVNGPIDRAVTPFADSKYANLVIQTVPLSNITPQQVYDKAFIGTLIDTKFIAESEVLLTNTDLNTVVDAGSYRLRSTATYINSPIQNINGTLINYADEHNTQGEVYQTLYAPLAGAIYFRRYYGSPLTWSNWILIYQHDMPIIDNNEDLDNYNETSHYRLRSDFTYLNAPAESVGGVLEVFKTFDASYAVQRITCTHGSSDTYIRVRSGSPAVWGAWMVENNNRIFATTADSFTGTYENTGTKVKIMSYNVANYNNDTGVYISDEKLINIKKLLSENDPDIIAVQEDNYLNGVDKSAKEYLYMPKYPAEYGTGGATLKSKINAVNNIGAIWFNDELRTFRAAIFSINNNKILMVSLHAVYNYNNTGGESAESIAVRNAEYDDIFKWVNNEISLKRYSDNVAIQCPQHDYYIIAGDFNSATDADRLNLKNKATSYNCTLANGGWLGWLETSRTPSGQKINSLDNIICSPGIVINTITVYNKWYRDLYSDHVPVAIECNLI